MCDKCYSYKPTKDDYWVSAVIACEGCGAEYKVKGELIGTETGEEEEQYYLERCYLYAQERECKIAEGLYFERLVEVICKVKQQG